MAGQAVGRKANFTIYNAVTFGSTSGVTSGEKAYLVQNGLSGTIARIVDDTLNGRRGMQKSVASDRDVNGSLPIKVAPESIPKWLAHLIGLSSTTYAAARKTTSLITGVEVLRCETGTTAGNGTLAFTASGTTITWAPSGDTAGTPVNIGAGGDFTVTSTGGYDIFLRVTASLLPVGNKNDTVDVEAGTVYDHVFTPRGTERTEGFLMETDFGSEISSSHRYILFKGLRASRGTFKFGASGFIEATIDCIGADFDKTVAAPIDATPDDYGHSAFSMMSARIELDGGATGDVKELNLTLDNDLDDTQRSIGGGGVRSDIPAGRFMVSGSGKFKFKDALGALLDNAVSGVSGSIVLKVYNGTGDGTSGNEAMYVRIPDQLFKVKTPGVSGPKGIDVDLEFDGHNPSSAESRFEVSLRTTRAAATF